MIDILLLDKKRKELNKVFYGENYINSKFLCVMDNGEPIKVDYITSCFTRTLNKYIKEEKAKNNEFSFPNITLHKLRHLNISALLANGAYLSDVKDSAGHSDINTTMHYTHNYIEGKKEIANKIDEIYAPLFKIQIG